MQRREKRNLYIFWGLIFGVLLLPCFPFHDTFSQEIYQSFDISDLFNLLAYFIETDKQGKMLPGKVGAVGYFCNGPFHKHMKDMISQFSYY